jgi:UDP-galactopyranose mutase
MNLDYYDVIVVGAGLSGIVMAEQFASRLNKRVLVIDKRDHIGGNCYDYIDKDTNILMNKYGAHLFHTNHEDVYRYITKFCKWVRWEHKVLGLVDHQYVCVPVNISTVNQLCYQNITTNEEMNQWLEDNQVKCDLVDNSEKIAKSRVGNVLRCPSSTVSNFYHLFYQLFN